MKLREAEVELSKGNDIGQVCRKLGFTEQTYYRWRKKYGGMKVEQARRYKELEAENTRLNLYCSIKGLLPPMTKCSSVK